MQTTKRAKIISASAGSGKTYSLVLKYICDIIERPDRYRNILAVTFTNKATEEMKSRIIKEIHLLASNQPSEYLANIIAKTQHSEAHIRAMALKARTKILHDYSRFTILTIDRFFQRILRAFINELSLDLNYNIELDVSMLLERSADTLIENIAKEDDIKDWLLEFAEERLNDGNRWDMRRDLRTLGEELFKEGGAKRMNPDLTKAQLRDVINKLVVHDNAVLKRIQELGEGAVKYLNDHGISPDEYSGQSRSFVYNFAKYAVGELKPPTDKMLKAANNIEEWRTKGTSAAAMAAAGVLIDNLNEICRLYNDNIEHINTTKLLRDNYRSFALLADLYRSLDDICKQENLMVLDKTKEILSKFIDQSNAPFIYEKVGTRFDHYMIDEFQDTSLREWHNLLPLLLEALASNPEASVFIVGDIKQSIYRWRGGDWRLLNSGVVEDLGAENIEIDRPTLNYRSLSNIVDFNRELIANIVTKDNYHLNTILDNALSNNKITQSTHATLYDITKRAYVDNNQTAATNSSEKGIAEVCIFDPKVTDSPFIEAIEDAISRGYRYRDILILVRGSSDGRKVAEALYAYKNKRFTDNNETSFNILTSDSLTIDSSNVVKFIISVFYLALNPANDIERGVYNGFLNHPFHRVFDDDDLALFSHLAHLSLIESFEVIVERFGLHSSKADIVYIQAMHEQILSFANSHIADIQHYLAWWEERGYKETLSVEMTDDTIEITTIHKAKGLERAVVIIPYCKWSMIPVASKSPLVWAKANGSNSTAAEIGDFPVIYGNVMESSAFSEEYYNELVMSHIDGLNMLYVAITRAANELYMYIPKNLNTKTKSSSATISDTTPLIVDAVSTLSEATKQYSADGSVERICYSYGSKISHYIPKQKRSSSKSIILSEYPTSSPSIVIRHPSSRYSEEGLIPGSEACRNGIILHSVLESAITEADLHLAIKHLELDCRIGTREIKRLKHNIERAMYNESVREWFSDVWDEVHTETGIISRQIVRRPDRVMIAKDRAVVVDYKFGFKIDDSHTKQVKEYMSLLEDMHTYSKIEGYVWYVNLDHIENC